MDRVVLQHQLDESRLQILILEEENRKLLSEINEIKSLLMKLHAKTVLSKEICDITDNTSNNANTSKNHDIHVHRSKTFTSKDNRSVSVIGKKTKEKHKKCKSEKSSHISSNHSDSATIQVRKSHTFITPATPTSISTVDKNGHRKKIKSTRKEKGKGNADQKRMGLFNGITSLVPSFWNRQQSISKGDQKPRRAKIPNYPPQLTPLVSLYKHNHPPSPPTPPLQPSFQSIQSVPPPTSSSSTKSAPVSVSLSNPIKQIIPSSIASISTSIPTIMPSGGVAFGSAPETEKERESLDYNSNSKDSNNFRPLPSIPPPQVSQLSQLSQLAPLAHPSYPSPPAQASPGDLLEEERKEENKGDHV